LNNFNSVLACISAINNAGINRLTASKEHVPAKLMQ